MKADDEEVDPRRRRPDDLGWPADDWVRRSPMELRLPIASAAVSGTLDLILLSGGTAGASLLSSRRQLVLATEFRLRHIRSPGNWLRPAPFIFAGDMESVGMARAALQEHRDQDALVLIESRAGGPTLPLEPMFQRACWRDGIICERPGSNGNGMNGHIGSQAGRIMSLLGRDAQVIAAGASESFLSAVTAAFCSMLGGSEVARLEATGRYNRIRL